MDAYGRKRGAGGATRYAPLAAPGPLCYTGGMNTPIPLLPEDWLEKQFTFALPLGAFLAVLERVRGTPARLDELVGGLPPAILTVRRGDAWSIQEQVGHLADLEALHEARLDDYRAGRAVLQAADMTNRRTYAANHNAVPIAHLLARFRAVRAAFVARLADMDAAMVGRTALHPRLNTPMRVIDLAQFVAEHDDHHLASIRLLAQELRE
jgi:hypothetical protein